MELRVLRYFLTVAREGSVTGAANFLRVTQPTLSRQIKELEEELGVQLLVRHSHSVTLTTEGMRLRQRAEEILDMVEKTESEFVPAKETIQGEVHIGGGETQAMRLVAEVIHDMRREYPGIHYQLHSGNAIDVAERLDKGLLDFGIFIQPADIAKYDSLELPAKDVWGVLMRKDSPLANAKTIKRKDLVGVPLMCSRRAMARGKLRNILGDWFGKDFDKLNIVATYNLIFNAAIMVERGIGYALSLDGLSNTAATSNLCFRLLEPKLESGLNIAWKKYHIFSPAAKVFLKNIQERYA